jgi:WD40 repeat protein
MGISPTFKKLVAHTGTIGCIATHGDVFLTGANRHQVAEGSVRIWSFSSGNLIGQIATDLNSIFGLSISPDNQLLAIGGGGAVFGTHWEYTGGVEVWNLELKKRITRFGEEELFFVKSICFSADQSVLLTASIQKPQKTHHDSYKPVRLWRLPDFKKMSAFGEDETEIGKACFSPNAKFVVFATNPASTVVKAPQGMIARLRRYGLSSLTRNERANTYSHTLELATPLLRIWNTTLRREEKALELPSGRIEDLAFSVDGEMLACCGSRLMTWDFEGLKPLIEFPHGSFSHCVAFSPGGEILASGGGYRSAPGGPYEDCGLKLWATKSGRMIAFLPHERPVYSLAFSLDGHKIVAGGDLGELLLWDIAAFFGNAEHAQ